MLLLNVNYEMFFVVLNWERKREKSSVVGEIFRHFR